jgi:hypothetical protein
LDRRRIKVLELWNWPSDERLLLLKYHDEFVRKLCRGGHRQTDAAGALLSELKWAVIRDDYFDVHSFALRSCHIDVTAAGIYDLPSVRHAGRDALVGRSVGPQWDLGGNGQGRLRASGGNDWDFEEDQDHHHGGDPQRSHGLADLHG